MEDMELWKNVCSNRDGLTVTIPMCPDKDPPDWKIMKWKIAGEIKGSWYEEALPPATLLGLVSNLRCENLFIWSSCVLKLSCLSSEGKSSYYLQVHMDTNT